MILGTSLSSFKGLTLFEAMDFYLKISKKLNLNAVEILFEKSSERPSLWYWEAKNSELRGFLENFKTKGAHLPFLSINPFSPNPRIREESIKQLKESMQKAAELEIDYTVMHVQKTSDKSGLISFIEEFSDFAKELSILLTIENADFLSNLALLVDMVRKVNSKWLKITFDVGHAHIRKVAPLQTYPIKDLLLRTLDIFLPLNLIKKNMPYEAYGSIQKFVKSNFDLIGVIHLHDYNGKRDHLPIGNGKINFSFMDVIKELFKGPYIFEAEFMDHEKDLIRNYYAFKKFIE